MSGQDRVWETAWVKLVIFAVLLSALCVFSSGQQGLLLSNGAWLEATDPPAPPRTAENVTRATTAPPHATQSATQASPAPPQTLKNLTQATPTPPQVARNTTHATPTPPQTTQNPPQASPAPPQSANNPPHASPTSPHAVKNTTQAPPTPPQTKESQSPDAIPYYLFTEAELADHESRMIVRRDRSGALGRLVARVAGGANLTVVIVGGSISVGSGSNRTYSKFLGDLLPHQFSGNMEVINLARSGSGSFYFAHCLDEYSLALTGTGLEGHAPDLVLVELSANDFAQELSNATRMKTEVAFEALVRGILELPSRPQVLLMNFAIYKVGYEECNCSRHEEHLALAEHYDLPVLALQNLFYINSTLLFDIVHMNFYGHALTSQLLLRFLLAEGARAATTPSLQPPPGGLPGPLHGPRLLSHTHCFTNTQFRHKTNATFEWGGQWTHDFRGLGIAKQPDSSMEVTFCLPARGHVSLLAKVTPSPPTLEARLDDRAPSTVAALTQHYSIVSLVDLYYDLQKGCHKLRIEKKDSAVLEAIALTVSDWDRT